MRFIYRSIFWCGVMGVVLADCGGEGHETVGNQPANYAGWPMHIIDYHYRGANALSPGDVNGDGLMDYVTNYEFDQRYVIELHPPRGVDPRKPWPTIVTYFLGDRGNGIGTDTEHAALADFDGDGNLDVVGAQGWHASGFFEGQNPGVRLIWGPPRDQLPVDGAWIDAGLIPDTVDRGHFLYVVPFDVNGDGAVDIVAGGRVQQNTQERAGVKWIEAPLDTAQRRDLTKWRVHDIDPAQFDGHGFVLTDVDGDGDLDIADANADFDTPEDEETVHWYENPGTGSAAQREPWPKHEIYRGSEFYSKPGIVAADLDHDGLVDLLTQVEDSVYWFRKTGLHPVTWERIVIPKPPEAQWLSRPIKVVDLNGDGKLDIVGMMTHRDGLIPIDKAAVFWMEYQGDTPHADNWITHVIKWGSGKPMFQSQFGEKWDQVQFGDVDGDGDLDIVADCEEWWADRQEILPWWEPRLNPTSVAVVWFENRLREAPYRFGERNGVMAIEAEHFSDIGDGTWIKQARFTGYAGDGYLQAHDGSTTAQLLRDETRGTTYTTRLNGGTYRLWVRRWVPSQWGYTVGRTESNSAWIDVDGQPVGDVFDNADGGDDTWSWVAAPVPLSLSSGAHVVTLRVREGGYAVDRILLASDAAFTPSDLGPPETTE